MLGTGLPLEGMILCYRLGPWRGCAEEQSSALREVASLQPPLCSTACAALLQHRLCSPPAAPAKEWRASNVPTLSSDLQMMGVLPALEMHTTSLVFVGLLGVFFFCCVVLK